MADNRIQDDFAYDDAFRTMESECDDIVIPFINYFFNEHYDETAEITRMRNEHFIERGDWTSEKRVTDSYLKISQGGLTKAYHLECESRKYDGSILVRMFEYDTQIALDESTYTNASLEVNFPHTGLLVLRDSRKTPRLASVVIRTPGGEVFYEIPVVCEVDFSIDVLFEKRLYFLLPFYIFNHEKRLKEYDADDGKLDALMDIFREITDRLYAEVQAGHLSVISYDVIIRLVYSVAYKLTAKASNVQRKVGEFMGGKVLDISDIKAYHAAIAAARAEGKAEGKAEGLEEGRAVGKVEGQENGIRVFIEDKIEGGFDSATIIECLLKRFNLGQQEAEAYLKKYASAPVA